PNTGHNLLAGHEVVPAAPWAADDPATAGQRPISPVFRLGLRINTDGIDHCTYLHFRPGSSDLTKSVRPHAHENRSQPGRFGSGWPVTARPHARQGRVGLAPLEPPPTPTTPTTPTELTRPVSGPLDLLVLLGVGDVGAAYMPVATRSMCPSRA